MRLGQYFLGDQPLTNLASFKTAEADSKRGMHGGMDKDSWARAYRLSEDSGEYVRLDWGDSPPQTEMREAFQLTGAIAKSLRWSERFSFLHRRARTSRARRGRPSLPHINVSPLPLAAVKSIFKLQEQTGWRPTL